MLTSPLMEDFAHLFMDVMFHEHQEMLGDGELITTSVA
jgi:hypothetical protein